MEGYVRSGLPSARIRARTRSSPNSSGQGESDSIQLTAESVELTAVTLQFLTLGFDHMTWRVSDEALVFEHPLCAGDFLLQPLDLGGGISVCLLALGLDD